MKEQGEDDKANSQFRIAKKVIDAFLDDFIERKCFKSTIYETMLEQRKEIEWLLVE